MMLPDRDQQRAEEAEQADHACASDDLGRGADLADDPEQRRLVLALHLHRLVGLGDVVDQQLLLLGRADDRGAAVALELVDQPGADRVHPLDFGEIDDEICRRRSPSSCSAELAHAQQGEVAAEPQDAAAVLDVRG